MKTRSPYISIILFIASFAACSNDVSKEPPSVQASVKDVAPIKKIAKAESGVAPKVSGAGAELYSKYCSDCHGEDRLGLVGPPLLPEYFGRQKDEVIKTAISEGLTATNMPPFKEELSDSDIDRLVSFIKTPVEKPVWGMEEMRPTWQVSYLSLDEKKPLYDMTNFFMIVEGGSGTVHFMDGDSFKLLGALKVGAIHGGPKFGRDLRYAFAVSRGGLLLKYDLIEQREVGRIRGGISTRNIAVSGSGKYLVQANMLPKNLVVIDAFSLKPVRIIEPGATVGAVYDLRERGEFVVSLKDKPQLLVLNDETLDMRKIDIDQPFTDFFIDPSERFLIGTSRGSDHFSIVDIESGKLIKEVKAEGGMPHLASAAVWSDTSGTYAAFPHIGRSTITVIKMYDWVIRGKVETKGPGFFARTHEGTKHIWADTGTDSIQLIDKETLKVVKELVPQAGKKAMHIEFNKDGSRALVSVWEDEGEVVIYDTKSLDIVKRMPFKKPVGKYNATNKRF
ncbi:MAG: cytochrome D1 domain-containing protein [bacterium]|nr:cytochrome D1 domain-containing protein [bacterium]